MLDTHRGDPGAHEVVLKLFTSCCTDTGPSHNMLQTHGATDCRLAAYIHICTYFFILIYYMIMMIIVIVIAVVLFL